MTRTISRSEMGPPPTLAKVQKKPSIFKALWETFKILVLFRWR